MRHASRRSTTGSSTYAIRNAKKSGREARRAAPRRARSGASAPRRSRAEPRQLAGARLHALHARPFYHAPGSGYAPPPMARIDLYLSHLVVTTRKASCSRSGTPVTFRFPSGERHSNTAVESTRRSRSSCKEVAPRDALDQADATRAGEVLVQRRRRDAGRRRRRGARRHALEDRHHARNDDAGAQERRARPHVEGAGRRKSFRRPFEAVKMPAAARVPDAARAAPVHPGQRWRASRRSTSSCARWLKLRRERSAHDVRRAPHGARERRHAGRLDDLARRDERRRSARSS